MSEHSTPVVALTSESANFEVSSSFKTTYEASKDRFDDTFQNIIIVVGVVSAFAWLFRMNTYIRRRLDPNIDLEFLMRALVELAFVGGMLLSFTLTITSWYWFLFYKLQDSVYTLIPQDDQIEDYYTALVCSVVFLGFSCVCEVLHQCNFDYFFLDWEKPRYHFNPGGVGGKGGAYQAEPVSAWRMLYVINQWNDMASWRATTPPMTYVISLFVIVGFNAKGLTTMTPDAGDLSSPYHAIESVVLRFAVSTFIVTVTLLVEYLFKQLLYYRYIKGHPLDDFLDVLTLSNISIFILFDNYAGYYLHGRSLMPTADTNLSEISNCLRMEAGNSMSKRGLIPDANQADSRVPDNQEFEIFLPRELRKSYDVKLLDMIEDKARGEVNRTTGISLGGAFTAPTLPEEKLLNAQSEIANTFRDFIHRVESDHENIVRERTGFGSMFGGDVGVDGNNPVFFHDFNRAWSTSIFFGNELRLAVFEMMVFATVFASSGRASVAAVVAILVDVLLSYMRQELGTNNVSRKSLVDPRFLM